VSVGREANLLALAKIRIAWLDGDGSASPNGPFFAIEFTAAKCRVPLDFVPLLILCSCTYSCSCISSNDSWCFYCFVVRQAGLMTAFSALNSEKRTQRAQSKHREPQRNPAVSLRHGLTVHSTGFSVPSVAFLRVLCVKFRKARNENVRFLQTFRRLVVQDIEKEDFNRPANDA